MPELMYGLNSGLIALVLLGAMTAAMPGGRAIAGRRVQGTSKGGKSQVIAVQGPRRAMLGLPLEATVQKTSDQLSVRDAAINRHIPVGYAMLLLVVAIIIDLNRLRRGIIELGQTPIRSLAGQLAQAG